MPRTRLLAMLSSPQAPPPTPRLSLSLKLALACTSLPVQPRALRESRVATLLSAAENLPPLPAAACPFRLRPLAVLIWRPGVHPSLLAMPLGRLATCACLPARLELAPAPYLCLLAAPCLAPLGTCHCTLVP